MLINLLFFWLFQLCVADRKEYEWPIKTKRTADVNKYRNENNVHGLTEKGYYVEMQIGTPAQSLNVVIDTGSSNFAVASQHLEFVTKFFESKNSTTVRDLGISNVGIEYIEGFWKGHIVSDIVTIPSANMIKSARVSIAEITSSKNFFINGSGWQGILGMAYTELVQPSNHNVKSFMQSVVEETGIEDVFSLQLCVADYKDYSDSVSGRFVIGGHGRNESSIYWTKVIREWYYDVVILGMKVGDLSVAVPCTSFNNDKAIVDSGTTNLRFPEEIFNKIVFEIKAHFSSAVPNASAYDAFWQGTEVLCWNFPFDPYKIFPPLTIFLPSTVPNHTIELQVHPEHYILFIKKGKRFCCKFGISSSNTGTVLGAVLMEEYVVAFDRTLGMVGFAISNCSTTSHIALKRGYPNTTVCSHKRDVTTSGTTVAVYVLLGVLLLFMLLVFILMLVWCRKRSPLVTDQEHLLRNTAE